MLSICMLEAEVRDGGMVIEKEPYYQVFRQHGRYVHSLHAETAHKLTEAEVQAGADIVSLHAKLAELVCAEGPGGVLFVAHNAVRDRQWLAQSIQEQIRYLAYTDCKNGNTAAGAEIAGLHALLDRMRGSQWFCTQHGDLDAAGHARSRNGALAKIMENRGDGLRGVYEKVTGRALQGQHDARVDTYACALIFFRLLLLNHGVDVETSAGYAKLQAMLAEVQDACCAKDKGERVVRKTEGSSMEALLTRIMKLLHEA